MKNFKLLGQTHLELKDLDPNSLDPAFRRATANMTLATLACEKLLKSIPQVPRDEISFLLGSHFGEIKASLDFLKTYHETGVPRPILFQNSLHNSTVGFATIHLGLTGPALTVSTDKLTTQSMFDLAENVLEMTPFAILCFVDCVPESISEHYRSHLPNFDRYQNQAYCFLIGTEEAQSQLKLPALKSDWDYFPCST